MRRCQPETPQAVTSVDDSLRRCWWFAGSRNLTCGRNYNNPRWLYINVDDNPAPFPELRRLLNDALAYDYGDLSYKSLEEHKFAEAKLDAEKAALYAPNDVDNHLMIGFLAYVTGSKDEALTEFERAKQTAPNFPKIFAAAADGEKEFGQILRDKAFLQQLFPGVR
jgi:tetratricopeptide (TPR) repeat protein